MANGMVMDGRFFAGETDRPIRGGFPVQQVLDVPVLRQRHELRRSWNCRRACAASDGLYGNAEVFTALKLLGTIKDNDGNPIVEGLTPEETRKVTI